MNETPVGGKVMGPMIPLSVNGLYSGMIIGMAIGVVSLLAPWGVCAVAERVFDSWASHKKPPEMKLRHSD